jgi:hypothetical protein
VNRVDGEDGGGEPGRGTESQHDQDAPGKERRQRVQQDVDRVVAGGAQPPQPILQPVRGVNQRVVLRCRANVEPDRAPAAERTQAEVLLDVDVVVPDELSLHGGRMSQQCDRQQKRPGGDSASARRGQVTLTEHSPLP